MKFNQLLTVDNAKTIKGELLGVLTAILYLAPEKTGGFGNICAFASLGCTASCLFTAGRGIMSNVVKGRMRKTREYFTDNAKFVEDMHANVKRVVRSANRKGMKLAIRLNGTSDLPNLASKFAAAYPEIQFYDYTKVPQPWKRVRPNYHLTFSLHENNLADALAALENGVNVAVVFDTKKGEPLPASYLGYPVLDGDEHDLRYLDPKGYIVGLRAKGKAKKDNTGFVVRGYQAAHAA